MNNLDEYGQWLNSEIDTAEEQGRYYSTLLGEDAPAAEYWRGYADAMTNAAAAYYGPTPLDEGAENE